MRSVDVSVAAGGRLGVAVKDERGRILLAAGTPLTAGLCDALARRGFRQLPIQDGIADDVAPRDGLTAATRALATQTAQACFRSLEGGGALPVRGVLAAVDAVLATLAMAHGAILEFATLRSVSDQSYVHSVNVCVYSLVVAQAMGLSGPELRALGAGALLHDVGKVLCADLCGRAEPLSAEDEARLRQHPIDGFEMLRQHHELHLFVAHIAYQHHEHVDGTGYPRALAGARILPVARIVAVANAFDALEAGTPAAKGLPAAEAVRHLLEQAGRAFDPDVVRVLARRLAHYPTGTPIVLSDGSVGIVVGQGVDPARPSVRLLGRAGVRATFEEVVQVNDQLSITQVLGEWPTWLRRHTP